MSPQIPDFSDFPKTVHVGSGKAGTKFRLRPTHFAVQHGTAPASPEAAGHIGIYPIDEYRPEVHGTQPTPVYSPGQGPSLAVPTGLVFVRLSPDLKIEDRTKNFEDAGYKLAKTVSYAPNAGWLRPTSGKLSDALANASKLNGVAGIENVEPQMLSQAARKG
jgi:hypothetical protein